MAIAVRGEVGVAPSLESLADDIRREIGEAGRCVASALQHAIAAGGLLSVARESMPRGAWQAWLVDEFEMSMGSAWVYVRLFRYQEEIGEEPSIGSALKALRWKTHANLRTPPREWMDKAKTLRDLGWSNVDIGEVIGVTPSAVRIALMTPDQNKRMREVRKATSRRKLAERDALRRQEQDKAAKAAGVSEQWAALHRLGEQMAQVSENGTTPEIRQAFASALKDIYRARDKVSAVLGQV